MMADAFINLLDLALVDCSLVVAEVLQKQFCSVLDIWDPELDNAMSLACDM